MIRKYTMGHVHPVKTESQFSFFILQEGKELASVDGKITITNAQTSDAGIYVCAAENDVGFTNRIAKLDVLGKQMKSRQLRLKTIALD